jgi:serine/threonine protein kinase
MLISQLFSVFLLGFAFGTENGFVKKNGRNNLDDKVKKRGALSRKTVSTKLPLPPTSQTATKRIESSLAHSNPKEKHFPLSPPFAQVIKQAFITQPDETSLLFETISGSLRLLRDSSTGKIYVMSSKRHLSFHKVLGSGSYGKVKLATDIDTGETIAVKKPARLGLYLDVERDYALENEYLPDSLKVSQQIITRRTKNGKTKPYLLMKYIPGRSVFAEIGYPTILLDKITEMYRFTQLELLQLHARGIVHRDAHLCNFIYNPTTHRIQIIDMGMAIRATDQRVFLDNLNHKAAWVYALEGAILKKPELTTLTLQLKKDLLHVLDIAVVGKDIYIDELYATNNCYPFLRWFIHDDVLLYAKFSGIRPASFYLTSSNAKIDVALDFLADKETFIEEMYDARKTNIDPSLQRSLYDPTTGQIKMADHKDVHKFKGPGNRKLNQLEAKLDWLQTIKKSPSQAMQDLAKSVVFNFSEEYNAVLNNQENESYLKMYPEDFPLLYSTYRY